MVIAGDNKANKALSPRLSANEGHPSGSTLVCLISVGGRFMWVRIYCGPHKFCCSCLGLLALPWIFIQNTQTKKFLTLKITVASSKCNKKNSMGNWELVWPTLIRQNNVLSGGRVKGPSPMEFPKQKVTPRALPSGGPCLRNSLGLGPYLGSTRIDWVLQCNFHSRKVIWVICIHRPK
jgi:hypothetical protein